MSGWHIPLWLFSRWLLSGDLFRRRPYPICLWCSFSWNLKVFAKISDKIPKIMILSVFLNLSYGNFEVTDIRLRCSLGQTNPLYAKIDLSYFIL